MNKLHLLLLAPSFVFTTQLAMAEPVDSGPPAQQQKDAVTNSTSDGNYLKDEAGTDVNQDASQTPDMTSEELQNNNANTNRSENETSNNKPPPLKGKSHQKDPEKGGVEVN